MRTRLQGIDEICRMEGEVDMGTLLAVFAHPDDETFICGGTLAKAAAEGHRVVLVCATKGEMGRRLGIPPTANRETIAAFREQELMNACQALGITELQWLGYRDKTLEIQPVPELVRKIQQQMERVQPDVVVTFHELWGGHPDHCTIGRAVILAFSQYVLENPVARLYFVAWSSMVSNAESYGLRERAFVSVDVSGHLEAKMNAYRAHRTQSQMMGWVWQGKRDGLRRLGATEYFLPASDDAPAGQVSLIG